MKCDICHGTGICYVCKGTRRVVVNQGLDDVYPIGSPCSVCNYTGQCWACDGMGINDSDTEDTNKKRKK